MSTNPGAVPTADGQGEEAAPSATTEVPDDSYDFSVPSGLLEDPPAGGIILLGDAMQFGDLRDFDFGSGGLVAESLGEIEQLEERGAFNATDEQLLAIKIS